MYACLDGWMDAWIDERVLTRDRKLGSAVGCIGYRTYTYIVHQTAMVINTWPRVIITVTITITIIITKTKTSEKQWGWCPN